MFAGLYPNEVAGLVFVDPTPDFTTAMPVSFDVHRWVRQWLNVRNASLRRFATSLPRGTFVETTTSSHQVQHSEPGLIAWAIERVLQQR